ncbi:cytochrome-c peroxidase [bacterium]|nr:cytochrome-c peroxidase [bacterium]
MKTIKNYLTATLSLIILLSCSEDEPKKTKLTPYEFKNPTNFPVLQIPADNPFTVEGIELGKMLYYDKILDKDSSRACANCHFQNLSFSSDATVLPHVNLAWNDAFLWNGKVQGTVEEIMLFEVDEFFQTKLERLNNHETYKKDFKTVFGVDQITSNEVAKALSQFIRTLVSSNSKYDKFLEGKATLTEAETRGRDLFYSEKGDCFHCHSEPLFSDNDFHNTGIDFTFSHEGLAEITGNSNDFGKFKTPTLRNIELTAPYFHDGSAATLEAVLDKYNAGLSLYPTVDPLIRPLGLSTQDKQDLIAFMKSLTDSTFLTNPAFASPF